MKIKICTLVFDISKYYQNIYVPVVVYSVLIVFYLCFYSFVCCVCVSDLLVSILIFC